MLADDGRLVFLDFGLMSRVEDDIMEARVHCIVHYIVHSMVLYLVHYVEDHIMEAIMRTHVCRAASVTLFADM